MPLFGKAKASLKSKDSKSSLKSKTPEPDSDSSGDDSGDDSEEVSSLSTLQRKRGDCFVNLMYAT